MPTGQEIANERFAKGEISEEEFDKITKKLNSLNPSGSADLSASENTKLDSSKTNEFSLKKEGWFFWWVLPLLGVAFRVTYPDIGENTIILKIFIFILFLCMAIGSIKLLFGKK